MSPHAFILSYPYLGEPPYNISRLKKTRIRNENYKYANIPCIIIDIEDLKILKINWFEFLDARVGEIKHSKGSDTKFNIMKNFF